MLQRPQTLPIARSTRTPRRAPFPSPSEMLKRLRQVSFSPALPPIQRWSPTAISSSAAAAPIARSPSLPQLISLAAPRLDRKSTRLNSSHLVISYAVFCLKKKLKHYSYNGCQRLAIYICASTYFETSSLRSICFYGSATSHTLLHDTSHQFSGCSVHHTSF